MLDKHSILTPFSDVRRSYASTCVMHALQLPDKYTYLMHHYWNIHLHFSSYIMRASKPPNVQSVHVISFAWYVFNPKGWTSFKGTY